MSSEAQDDEVIPTTTSMGYQKLTEPDIETGDSLGPAAKGGSISMTKGFLATLLTANTCCTSFVWIILGAVLYMNGFTPRASELQPRLDPPSPPPPPPGISSSCTIYHASAAVFEGVMHKMTADGLTEVETEEGEIATEGDDASLGFSNAFAPTFFDLECLLANGTGDPCDAYVAEAFADQMFDPLRVDSLVRLWLSTIFLYSLAQIGGIPRPRFIDRRIDWPGCVFWLSWMVTQLCQFFVVGISLGMQIVAFFGVYERTAPCMVRVDNFTLLDEFAMVTFAAQPALLSKLLLLVIYGYLLSLGGLVFIGRNMNEVDFKAEASKTSTRLVQPIPLASVLYFISRWALYGICLGTVGGWLGGLGGPVASWAAALVGWIPSKPNPSLVPPIPLYHELLLISWWALYWALYCLGTVGGWLGWPVALWAAALVAAAVGSFTGGFKRGNDSLSRATIAECALGVLLALPILPNLVYLPLGGLFLAFVKLSFAAGRSSLDLIDSTEELNWARWKRLEALTKTAAAATKPTISWLAPLGSLKLSSGMSMVVQGLPYTETSLSTLAGGIASVLGCLALSPLVAYGTWAAEQGRLEPDYDVEASTVDAVQARLWILWLLVVAMPVLLSLADEFLEGKLLANRCLNILLTNAFPFLLALAIIFTSQDDSFIERLVYADSPIWKHAQVCYADSFAFLATLQLDVSGLQPFIDSVMADMVAFTGDPLGAAQEVVARLAEIAADPLAPVGEVVEAVANMSRYLEIDASYFVEHSAALDILNVALGLLKLLATYGRKAFAFYDVVLGLFSGEKKEVDEEDDGVVQVHECVADPKKAQHEADLGLILQRGVYSEDESSLKVTNAGLGDGDAATLALWLKDNKVLTSLDVGGNSLTEEAALSIVRIERQRSKLTSLGLAGCSVGPTGAAEIAEYVSGSAVLTNLNLSANVIGDEGAKALASALRKPEGGRGGTVRRFGLRGVGTGAGRPARARDADGVNRVLTDLNLGNNEIRDEGAAAIAEALRGNRVLTDLNLGNNEIRDEGAAAIAEALRVNGVLTKLYLAFNSIGDDGAEALASALRVNGVLKNINLLRNDITVEGAALLLKLFRKRRHMESLCGVTPGQTEANFANMRLGDADAVLIGADLEFNGVLKNLELQDNSIGKDGAAALASALRVNGVLKDLKLWNNNLGGEGKGVIRDAVSGITSRRPPDVSFGF